MNGNVIFVGGELDGRQYCLPEIPPRYKTASYRPKPIDWSLSGADCTFDTPLDIRETEYISIKRSGALFYVESELFELSREQGIDPCPSEIGLS